MIRRHPHVFTANDRDLCHAELSQQWNTIKSTERAESGQEQGPLAHIPVSLPALQRAQKTLSRIKQAGLQSKLPDLDSVNETLDEEQLGQALFNLVRRAEASGLDAEGSLRKTICSFLNDFQTTEEKVS
jgi:XTP/dITP diphosphohydrolase